LSKVEIGSRDVIQQRRCNGDIASCIEGRCQGRICSGSSQPVTVIQRIQSEVADNGDIADEALCRCGVRIGCERTDTASIANESAEGFLDTGSVVLATWPAPIPQLAASLGQAGPPSDIKDVTNDTRNRS
jgi:hypothetical protein